MSALEWMVLLYVDRDWLTLAGIAMLPLNLIGLAVAIIVAARRRWFKQGMALGQALGYLDGRRDEREVIDADLDGSEVPQGYPGMDALVRFYNGPLGVPWDEEVCEGCGAPRDCFDPNGVPLCLACAALPALAAEANEGGTKL